MSRTAESYVDKPRKFAHDFFKGVAILFGGVTILGLLVGGNFVPALIVSAVSGYAASKIKYTWMKQVEVGGYKLV